MVRLVISAAMADKPSLVSVVDAFSKANVLLWLADAGNPRPSTAPAIESLEELASLEGPIFLVASSEECAAPETVARKTLRIVERGSSDKGCALATVKVDQFEQLRHLLSLDSHPGLSRLLAQRDWQAKDFVESILKRYGAALERLRAGRSAAIFGAQRLGQLVLESLQEGGVTVQAFIDNSPAKHGTSHCDTPVCPLSQITDKELPVVIATTKYTYSIAKQLDEAGFKHVLPYSVMSLVDPVRFPDEIPYIGIQEDFACNLAEYVGLFLCMADDKSRKVLDGLILYRLDYDAGQAVAVADEYARQYFDRELIQYDGDDVFVDLGGYDGDTAEKFIQYSAGKYHKIYLFEPDKNLLQAATKRLKGEKHIEYIDAGAYSKDGELRFSASGRTNGAICERGELVIPVRKIDNAVVAPTLIKMDIEGAEGEALRGAASHIRTQKPRLAIAAYHYASDLWQLVDVVREMNPAYRFYLRHYSESGLESVMYAL